ncbi:MAG: peptide chain release factor-like protein [Gammaproteobacteria bacterium]|nr:peptide chain release factor-like protein [Gammaproteobacteria bacterium]
MTETPPRSRFHLDRARLAQEVRLDTFRAGGPGGQHLHKTESAVRLTHWPSGVVVTASDTRSQARNRELAFERLIARLKKLNTIPKKRKKTRAPAAAKKRRLEGKRHAATTKRLRGRVRDEV